MSQIIRKSTRYALYIRNASENHGDLRCVYCGEQLTSETAQLDHIHPRADGGSNDPSNLVVACSRCNRRKSTQPWAQFVTYLTWAEAIRTVEALVGHSDDDAVFAVARELYSEVASRVNRERSKELNRAAGREMVRLEKK